MTASVGVVDDRLTTGGFPVLSPEERLWLKQEFDRRKRGGMRASPRFGRTRRRIPVEVLDAAYRSYADGVSAEELAAAIWQQYDFSSEQACRKSLLSYFRTAS